LLLLAIYILAISWRQSHTTRPLLLYNVGLFTASYFIKSQWFPSYYDTGKKELLLKNLGDFDWIQSGLLEPLITASFWPISLSCLLVLIYLVVCRQWFSGILLLGFIICYLILTALTKGDITYDFYTEGNFLVLFFVAGYAYCSHLNSADGQRQRYLIGFLFIVGFLRIGIQSTFYSERISWYQELVQPYDRKILTYGAPTKKQLIQSWSSPFESLIISTIKGPSKTMIFSDNPDALDKTEIRENKQMITTHGRFLIYNTDNQYFKLADKNYSLGHLD